MRSLTREQVIERCGDLPVFPPLISQILETIDDPEANLTVLTRLVQLDPVISGRVLSLANMAAGRTRHISEVHDVFTATSLIGIGRVRQMALVSSVGGYFQSFGAQPHSSGFWEHSVAVGVCSEELALHISLPVSADMALMAGLLHDVGQLWLQHLDAERFAAACEGRRTQSMGIEDAGREHFGVDHAQVGAWLAEYWSLPDTIVRAIEHHHRPDNALDNPIIPIVHVAETLANALDLTGRAENRVSSVSAAACKKIGIEWNAEIQSLFGRMEARSRHATSMLGTSS